jgi:hypothetical protein
MRFGIDGSVTDESQLASKSVRDLSCEIAVPTRSNASFARQRISLLARMQSQFEHALRNLSFGSCGFCRYLIEGLFFISASV